MLASSLQGVSLGKYRLKRLLGRGGMGEVYQAEERMLQRQLAIKVLRGSDATVLPDQEAVRLFRRELRAVASLNHAAIVPLFDHGQTTVEQERIFYMVMPLYQGGSLAQWRQHRQPPLATKEVAALIRQVARALQYAHDKQVLHLDVKPANLLIREVTTASDLPELVLADFGIARISQATSSANLSYAVRGTPTYMAPEQWRGEPVDASDQYALAVMAYDLLVGHSPFRGSVEQLMYQHAEVTPERPSALNPKMTKRLDVVLLQGLAKEPERRFASIAQFAQALAEQVARQVEKTQVVAGVPPRTSRSTARRLSPWRGYSSPQRVSPCCCYGGTSRCMGPCPGWRAEAYPTISLADLPALQDRPLLLSRDQ